MIMVASNLFGLEFLAFYGYTVFVLYTVLFAPDCFPIATMFCCGYMLFSAGNNPASNYGNTIFADKANKIQFIAIVCVIVVSLLTRFLFEIFVVKRENKRVPALTWGFVALGVAYVLGGLFTSNYTWREFAYSLLQIGSLCLTYFYFYYTVDWEKRSVSDGATMLTIVACGLLVEIAGMYLNPASLEKIKNDAFTRNDLNLACGWGIYNNVGGMMAMLMPAPFYFAATEKKGWLYLLLGSVFMGGIVLSQSRGAILAGGVVYVACCVFSVLYMKKEDRKIFLYVLGGIFACVAALAVVVFTQEGNGILGTMISSGADDHGRFEIYEIGLKQFLESPIFGKGFYGAVDVEVYQHGWNVIPDDFFLPPRYHNTVVQLLASGGLVALLAYLFHRWQTVLLVVKDPAPHKTFLGLAICAHLVASLLDCHVFNFGPGLTYGIILLCAEMLGRKKQEAPKLLEKE